MVSSFKEKQKGCGMEWDIVIAICPLMEYFFFNWTILNRDLDLSYTLFLILCIESVVLRQFPPLFLLPCMEIELMILRVVQVTLGPHY